MAERSAAERLKELVEAAEREAATSREAIERVAERAEALVERAEALAAAVSEAAAALRRELETLHAEAPPPEEDPGTRVEGDADDELIAEAEAVAGRAPEVEEAPPAVPEGARLLALKMALDGRPREETAAYLRDNFELDDAAALLDEVYARAEARK